MATYLNMLISLHMISASVLAAVFKWKWKLRIQATILVRERLITRNSSCEAIV